MLPLIISSVMLGFEYVTHFSHISPWDGNSGAGTREKEAEQKFIQNFPFYAKNWLLIADCYCQRNWWRSNKNERKKKKKGWWFHNNKKPRKTELKSTDDINEGIYYKQNRRKKKWNERKKKFRIVESISLSTCVDYNIHVYRILFSYAYARCYGKG